MCSCNYYNLLQVFVCMSNMFKCMYMCLYVCFAFGLYVLCWWFVCIVYVFLYVFSLSFYNSFFFFVDYTSLLRYYSGINKHTHTHIHKHIYIYTHTHPYINRKSHILTFICIYPAISLLCHEYLELICLEVDKYLHF